MPKTKAQAVLQVDKHVEPKACFVTYTGNKDGWAPLEGTGCAHWVAHEVGIKKGVAGSNACDLGYAIRVKDVIDGKGAVPVDQVKVGDHWASPGLKHCGLVEAVEPPAAGKTAPKITIRNCSSAQGGVFSNDWADHFQSGGTFYR